MTTTNLADFGHRERKLLIELLKAQNEEGLPDDFGGENVHPMMNQNSGNVFLTNEDFDVAMINDNTGKLESFYTLHGTGKEGFLDDLLQMYNDGEIDDDDDVEQFKNIAENNHIELKERSAK